MQKTDQTNNFSGPLADILNGFVAEKQATGDSYSKAVSTLKRFDLFCINTEHDNVDLTKELVLNWTRKQQHEKDTNQTTRVSLMRMLGSYMVRNGYNYYIYPSRVDIITDYQYVPHIFTNKELASLFQQADRCTSHNRSPNRPLMLPLIFRILYGCGLRISEVLKLRVKDVLLDDGTLQILNAKFNKDRLVPLCPSLSKRCRDYMQRVHFIPNPEEYFFPSPLGGKYKERTIYQYFRRFLWQAGISHGGRGSGPRLHDLRHTFAVHCLKRWVVDGVDLTVALPFLSTYLGHTGLKGTQRYLRLTAELYPGIVSAVETKFSEMIPEVNYEIN